MTEDKIRYWAMQMQKAAIGSKSAKHQIRVMEKMLEYSQSPSLKTIIKDAAERGLLKGIFD